MYREILNMAEPMFHRLGPYRWKWLGLLCSPWTLMTKIGPTSLAMMRNSLVPRRNHPTMPRTRLRIKRGSGSLMTEAKIPAKGRIDLEDADVDLLATFYKIQSFCSFFEWVRLVNYLPVTDNRKAVSDNGVKGSIEFLFQFFGNPDTFCPLLLENSSSVLSCKWGTNLEK